MILCNYFWRDRVGCRKKPSALARLYPWRTLRNCRLHWPSSRVKDMKRWCSSKIRRWTFASPNAHYLANKDPSPLCFVRSTLSHPRTRFSSCTTKRSSLCSKTLTIETLKSLQQCRLGKSLASNLQFNKLHPFH